MSNSTPEFHQLTPALAVWHCYSPVVKAELFSTVIRSGSSVYLIDPIHVDPKQLIPVLGNNSVAGVIATNANHEREAALYTRQFSTSFYAREEAGLQGSIPIRDGQLLEGELRVIAIEGAAPGECALYDQQERGTLIVGDALINMGVCGFTFLPPKYCANQKLMRKSLRKLLVHSFQRMVFAHGPPLVGGARDRLRALLDGET